MTDLDYLVSQFGLTFLQFRRLVDRRMAAGGASLARTKLLLYLDREGPARAADIADLFGTAPRTVTEAIDALEREGLVRREPHATDRRAKLIHITAEGQRVIASTEPLRASIVGDVFGTLSDQDRTAFSRVLEHLLSAIREQER